MNIYSGNGSSLSTFPNGTSNNFGVGLVGTSKDNLIEKNKIGGNLNGVLIMSSTQGGNIIRRNIIAGNPPAQFGPSVGADIQDLSTPGTNTFEDNRCLTYSGGVQPAPCPSISKPNEDEERDIAAFGRHRLAFPHARLVDAVFHPTALGQPSRSPSSNSVTVTGKVVDAACYMLHIDAATAASHKDCGAACLARGVPLAIATNDGALYFPADGNQRLKSLLNARVQASGTVIEKHDPMELKMPVGDKNQMVVRMEGGYKQITIETLTRIQAEKR